MVVIYGWGCIKMFFVSSPNVLADFPVYSSSQTTRLHLYQYIIPLLHCIWSLSFGNTSMFLIVLEVCVNAILTAYAFNAFAQAPHIWNDYVFLCLLFCLVFLLFLLQSLVFWGLTFWKSLCCILSKACAGYLQLVRASLVCCSSVLSSSDVDDSALALGVKVLMTLKCNSSVSEKFWNK